MTDNPRPHMYAARAATVLCILLLLFLFIFPGRHMKRLHDELSPYLEETTLAVVERDWEKAREKTARMCEIYAPYDKPLRLYMDHEAVDALQARLLSGRNLAMVEDDQIIVDLEDAKSRLRYMHNVECFTIWNLF